MILHESGISQKKTEQTIKKEFLLSVSSSSLNRHFKNCVEEQKKDDESQNHDLSRLHAKMKNRPLKGIDLHKTLCNILAEEIEMFMKKVDQRETTPGVPLENLKCLDILISMTQKLYPEVKGDVTQDDIDRNLYMNSNDLLLLLDIKKQKEEERLEKMSKEELTEHENENKQILLKNKTENKNIIFEEFRAWLFDEEEGDEREIRVISDRDKEP